MTIGIDRRSTFGLGKESSFGGGATPTSYFPAESVKMRPLMEFLERMGMRGRIESHHDKDIIAKSSELSFEGDFYDSESGHLLMAAFGSVSTGADTPESGVHTHTFTVKNDQVPRSYQMEKGSGPSSAAYIRALGCVLNSLELDVVEKSRLRYNCGWMGKFPDDTEDGTAAYTEGNVFMSYHVSFQHGADLTAAASADATPFKQVKVNINKNALVQFLNSLEPSKIPNGKFECLGEITTLFEDATLYDLFKAGTKQAVIITITNTNVTIGAASNPKLTLQFPKCTLEEMDSGDDLDDVNTQKYAFVPEYDDSEGFMAKAILINTKTGY